MLNFADLAFADLPALLARHAADAPGRDAVVDPTGTTSYGELDRMTDAVAAALQRDGVMPGDSVAFCGAASMRAVALYLGILRAGAVAVPLSTGVTPDVLARMLDNAQARCLALDRGAAPLADGVDVARIALDDDAAVGRPWTAWLADSGGTPAPVTLTPDMPLNIIYSSGTTGEPKGIVQSHGMRFNHIQRGLRYGYGPDTRTLLSTPLYSNTTLVVFFPTLAFGGTVVLQPKFDAGAWLALAARERITHTMLVPVQYRRLLAHPDFDRTDLSAFRMRFCTSAPFPAELKAEVLRRWPGGLVEFYGMTEGGGTCLLEAHVHPDKLHTVGRPAPGHELRLIDEQGRPCGPGDMGEVVGRSPGMMTGYHRRPEATREAEWFDDQGRRHIRTGDVGRFDEDGFLVLLDRRKDLIISGGFNVYPSDLEAVLRRHPEVEDVAVVGVPSPDWGETPVAFVVPRSDAGPDPESLRDWANAQLGKTQRLHALRLTDELPRNAIGKVLKRALRELWLGSP